MLEFVPFKAAREVWERALSVDDRFMPFMSYDWHKVWYETLGKEYSPLVLAHNQSLVFPFAVKGGRVIFSGGNDTSDYLEMIGISKDSSYVWDEVLLYLAARGLTTLTLSNVPEGPTVALFRSKDARVWQENTTPLLDLPQTFEEYLVNLPRRWRKELKRKMRNFEEQHNDAYLEEVGSIDCLISLMKKNEDKRAFFDRPGMENYFRKVHATFPEMARIRCLSVQGELAASIYYFETPTSYLLYNSGFDKEKYTSAGLYLKILNIKQAIEQGKQKYNFLQGNERYKYELGAKDFWVYTITLDL